MTQCIRIKITGKKLFTFQTVVDLSILPTGLDKRLVQSISIIFFCSQTSRDLATTPSCIFLCFFSRFPRLMMMMMMLVLVLVVVEVIVVVFPVTTVLATFSFSPLFFSRERKSTPSRSSNRQHISVAVLL